MQTRLLVGALPGDEYVFTGEKRYTEKVILELARQRLEQFSFIGILEQFGQSLQLLTRTFDWDPVSTHTHLNRGEAYDSFDSCSTATQQAIRAATELDRELYNHALALFSNRCQQLI